MLSFKMFSFISINALFPIQVDYIIFLGRYALPPRAANFEDAVAINFDKKMFRKESVRVYTCVEYDRNFY